MRVIKFSNIVITLLSLYCHDPENVDPCDERNCVPVNIELEISNTTPSRIIVNANLRIEECDHVFSNCEYRRPDAISWDVFKTTADTPKFVLPTKFFPGNAKFVLKLSVNWLKKDKPLKSKEKKENYEVLINSTNSPQTISFGRIVVSDNDFSWNKP